MTSNAIDGSADPNTRFELAVNELRKFLPGGSQIADFVGRTSTPLVEAGSVGGVSAAADWFVDKVVDGAEHSILFLIGAPGNGKSYWSSQIVKRCETSGFTNPDADGRHRRSYRYSNAQKASSLVVVNDATASDGNPAPTRHQLKFSLLNREFLQVNINRGVFFREMAIDLDDPEDQFEQASSKIMTWLASVSGREVSGAAERIEGKGFSIDCSPVAPHETVVVARLELDGIGATTLVAVRMDLHSILEPEPAPAQGPDRFEIQSFSNYRITKPGLSNWDSTEYWKTTAGGRMVHGVIETLEGNMPERMPSFSPIRANIEHLSQPSFANGLLSIMRMAELCSGRHFAIRHMWAGIAISILGLSLDEIDGEVSDIAGSAFKTEDLSVPNDGLERLVCLMKLSNFRTHQSVFGAVSDVDVIVQDGPAGQVQRPDLQSDFVKVMSWVDPVTDATPGFSNRKSLATFGIGRVDEIREGWNSAVSDAFRGVLENQNEGGDESIIDMVSQLLNQNIDVEMSLCDFDRELDKSIVNMLVADQTSEPWLKIDARNAVLAWYADYLSRLVAVHLGIAAKTREIAEYVENWIESDDGQLFGETDQNLLQLILPSFEGQDVGAVRLVGLFRPRTEAVTRPTSTPRMVTQVPRVEFSASSFGDSIVLSLNQRQQMAFKTLLKINLDVDLLSETHLSVRNYRGLSEKTDAITPMIERFRASASVTGTWSVLDGERIGRI
jgi:hypothetical protein